ncbi:MAG: ThiF family adenylyltransferase, partial [Gammaproteobacteria bacterium]|nr:ThiF family adenylyltransferase [Gammaproteobacteria bacterium]
VVDAADSFLVSYLLSDACFKQRIPLISASVVGTEGYLGVFCGTKAKPAPSLRSVFPTPSSQAKSCATAGVTGPSVGIIGSYQAQETIKVLLGDPTQLLGKLMNLNLWNYQQTIIDFSSAPEPSSQAKIIAKAELIESDVLLDLRTTDEVSETPIVGIAKTIRVENIPLDELAIKHETLPKSTRIVCLCHSGQRALFAANWLLQHGHSSIAVTA